MEALPSGADLRGRDSKGKRKRVDLRKKAPAKKDLAQTNVRAIFPERREWGILAKVGKKKRGNPRTGALAKDPIGNLK